MATSTPNIGLQVPGQNQANYQVPINYDLNLIDLIFGGTVLVPGLQITNLTVTNLAVANFATANFAALIAASFVAEIPAGSIPGITYTLTYIPIAMMAFFNNGLVQRNGTDYTLINNIITMNNATTNGGTVYALYFH